MGVSCKAKEEFQLSDGAVLGIPAANAAVHIWASPFLCLYPLTCDVEVITVMPAPVVALRIK